MSSCTGSMIAISPIPGFVYQPDPIPVVRVEAPHSQITPPNDSCTFKSLMTLPSLLLHSFTLALTFNTSPTRKLG
jgi:hypothetical protein